MSLGMRAWRCMRLRKSSPRWPARADGRTVADHVGQEASELQFLQQMQRLLWLLALPAHADGRFVDDYVRHQSLGQHDIQKRKRFVTP